MIDPSTAVPPIPRRRGRWAWPLLALLATATLAAITVVLRMATHHDPLTSDEAGFLIVGGQWHRGTSLYGDYWVDRPPGLIGIFWLAATWGGTTALRWIGTVTAVATVLGAAWAVLPLRRTAPYGPTLVAAGLTTALLTSRYLQAEQVNGELLGLPWLILGIGCLLRGVVGRRRRSAWWWVLAGACAATAISIKQNLIDVVLVGALLWIGVIVVRCQRRPHRQGAGAGPVLLAVAFAVGGLGVAGGLIAGANRLGASPRDLWDAVVAFRAEASKLILDNTPRQTLDQADSLISAFWASGIPIVLLLLMVVPWWRSRPRLEQGAPSDPAAPADPAELGEPGSGGESPGARLLRSPYWSAVVLLLLLWEGFAVTAGGSYWWHYLLCLVPGVVLLAATAAARQRTPVLALVAVLGVAVATGVGNLQRVNQPSGSAMESRALLAGYLLEHREPGDELVVAFGDPRLVYQSKMSSPYPYLWSLPVRVRDPELHEFQAMLGSPAAPEWIVLRGSSLAGFGVGNPEAAAIMRSEYETAYTAGGWAILRRDVPHGAPPGEVLEPTSRLPVGTS